MATAGRRTDTKTQVQRLLGLLNKHSDVVSDSLTGSVEPQEKAYSAAVDALVGINALLPLEEGIYHLNPRIRSYLSEQMAQYSAFQALTRISDQIHSARSKWLEMLAIKHSGDLRDMQVMEDSFTLTVTEIHHFMTQNLLLLSTQIATDFGNVKTLRAKLQQNKFYADGVRKLSMELEQLEAFCNDMDKDSLGKGFYYVRQIVNTRIRSRLPEWFTRVNDVQATISRKLFESKELEVDVLLWSQSVLWLTRNPTLNGLDVAVDEKCPADLCIPTPIKVRPQLDVMARPVAGIDVIAAAVARLPKVVEASAAPEPKVIQKVLRRGNSIEEVALLPEEEMIEDLKQALLTQGHTEISGLAWQPDKRAVHGINDESWLLFLASQLALQQIPFTFSMLPREKGWTNDRYSDVVAQPLPFVSELELSS